MVFHAVCDLHEAASFHHTILCYTMWSSGTKENNPNPTGLVQFCHSSSQLADCEHDDVIKRGHFPRYWSFVRGIRRSPVNSPHKGQ